VKLLGFTSYEINKTKLTVNKRLLEVIMAVKTKYGNLNTEQSCKSHINLESCDEDNVSEKQHDVTWPEFMFTDIV
jgi:hypothetical protein